ncbi:autoinducer 2-binding periplasmic protein LuxP [Vibrio halioticoli NBRC 102217]|uniref:Autoinducer 2-binding periplasmic protein LuxP n=1 Tax=Vibrio halioticoli NBRC 102217 TaxID=1219072 RepID=V5HNP4_9VIBR|nr:substrate-binding domain-containing protein [Vibrio halioticoli]GAD90850.1 autoinducer 2-binding periplasmic protein LuxP [Vibrio halioticoli NBRC 102217]
MRNTLTALLLLFTSTCFANDLLLDYWQYDKYLEQHPTQNALTQQMHQRIYQAPVPLKIPQDKPIEIDIVYPGTQLSDYWWRNIKALELRLNELGIDYRLRKYSSRPNMDYRRETESLQTALNNAPDYLIFTLDTSRHKKFAENLLTSSNRDTKLILINITTPIKHWKNHQPLMYVGFDHVLGTKLLANEYQKAFPEQADFGMMYFSPGYISEARGDTFIKYMKSQGDYSLKSAYFTNANRQSAYEATISMLKKQKNLDFIYACSTDLAFGVTQALSQLDRRDVMVNGWGGGAEIEAVADGIIDFTVVRMTDDTGIAMAEAIKLDLQNKPVPQVFSGDYEVLTKYDDNQKIEALKSKAFRYSDR